MYLTGLGNGLMYMASCVIVQLYFDRRRAMATGITVAGSGVGILAFGFIAHSLIERFNWQTTLFIEAGIMFAAVACAVTFRPLPTGVVVDYQTALLPSVDERSGEAKDKKHSYGAMDIDERRPILWKQQIEIVAAAATTKPEVISSTPLPGTSDPLPKSSSTASLPTPVFCASVDVITRPLSSSSGPFPLPSPVVFFAASGATAAITNTPSSATSAATAAEPEVGLLRDILDFSPYRCAPFALVCIACAGFSFCYHVTFTYLPDRAIKTYGIDFERASRLVSFIGLANVGSRVVFGGIGDRSPALRFYLAGFVLVICGIQALFIHLVRNYVAMVVHCFIFGTLTGKYGTDVGICPP